MCDHHHHDESSETAAARLLERRGFLKAGVAAGLVAGSGVAGIASKEARAAGQNPYADPAEPALPSGGMELNRGRVALVVTDPQVDFLSPEGVTWGVVGKSVEQHGTVANIERLFKSAKRAGIVVAISPHYYYPTDHGWKF